MLHDSDGYQLVKKAALKNRLISGLSTFVSSLERVCLLFLYFSITFIQLNLSLLLLTENFLSLEGKEGKDTIYFKVFGLIHCVALTALPYLSSIVINYAVIFPISKKY